MVLDALHAGDGFGQIDALFTDRAPPPAFRDLLARADVALHIADGDLPRDAAA